MFLLFSIPGKAAMYSEIWTDFYSIYGKSVTEPNGFMSNHTQSANVILSSPGGRNALDGTGWVSGTAIKTVSLAWSDSDQGTYLLSGSHHIDCPFNQYDQSAFTGGQTQVGTSINCFKLDTVGATTCYYDNLWQSFLQTILTRRIAMSSVTAQCYG
jgi:hypothetical protein